MKRGRSNWKAITLDIDDLSQGETALYELTAEQNNALLSMCEYFGWSTRWTNPPTDINLFKANVRYALMSPIDICELVADCIMNNENVQNALASQSAIGGNANTVINNTVYSNTTLIASNADANGCTDDARYGRIEALVDYINTVQEDFYQSIDAATNVLGELSTLVSAIPLFETLPFDELVATIADTGEQWDDSYVASYNTQLKEDFICNLWCRLGDCDVTIADVREAIEERYDLNSTQGSLNVLSLLALFARIAQTVATAGGLTYIGDDFVYLSWLLQIAAVEATGQFFGVSIGDYVGEAANGSPSGLWSGCTPCPVPTTIVTYNDVNFADWLVVRGNVPLFGAFGFSAGTSPFLLRVENFVLSGIMKQMDFVVSFDANGNVRTLRVLLLDGVNVVFDQTQAFGVGNNQNFGWSVNLQFDQIIVIATAGTSGGAAAIIEMTYEYA